MARGLSFSALFQVALLVCTLRVAYSAPAPAPVQIASSSLSRRFFGFGRDDASVSVVGYDEVPADPEEDSDAPTPSSPASSDPAIPTFKWLDLKPSKNLTWTDCLPGRQCARFIVPLDYSDPNAGEAVLAMIRKPANVSTSSPDYKGPLLFNPGGPGQSGVDAVGGPVGDLLSAVVGPQFDIVSFDPRGVSRSTPKISFFKTRVERAIFDNDDIVSNKTDGSVNLILERAKLQNQLAQETDNGYLKHMNTDQTARDMLSIVQAHGREKIVYWGISYGTVLGATFATMFPDKVDRLLIDGVFDSDNYYSAILESNLVDTDKVLQSFFDGCAAAGAQNCPFFAPSADAIRQKFDTLSESLRLNPIAVRTPINYGIVNHATFRKAVFASLFSPLQSFPQLAQGLVELSQGNATTFYEINRPQATVQCDTDAEFNLEENLDDAISAIICNDSQEGSPGIQETNTYLDKLAKDSTFGDVWSIHMMACAGWPQFKVANQFKGPIGAQTSSPILLIGNTADPVTPLRDARKMSTAFPGSVVINQNSAGHTSISVPSVCTQRLVRDYFISGTMPPADTVCQPDVTPFPLANATVPASKRDLDGMDLADRELFDVTMELSARYLHGPRFPM